MQKVEICEIVQRSCGAARCISLLESRWSPKSQVFPIPSCSHLLVDQGGIAITLDPNSFHILGDLSVTMRIDPDQLIAGIRSVEIRDLLRKCDGGFRVDWLDDKGFSARARNAIVRELVRLGYIEPSKESHYEQTRFPWYSITELGYSFARGLAAKPVTRAHAERTLNKFMERVSMANQRDDLLVSVTEVVLYGSFLRGSDYLGDVDLACRREPKFAPQDGDRIVREHFRKSARSWTRIGCEYSWAFDEVWQFLKNRKRTLSLHHIDDFLGMKKDDLFSYRVLLGDPDKIARDLQESEQKRQRHARS